MPQDRWGENRAATRARRRMMWIAGTGALLAALPFALHFGARHYAAAGGAMPEGRFPIWIPVAFWITAIAVAIVGTLRLYRLSDEFERQRMVESIAGAGAVLLLLVPPTIFLDLLKGGAALLLWLLAVATGLTMFARRRLDA